MLEKLFALPLHTHPPTPPPRFKNATFFLQPHTSTPFSGNGLVNNSEKKQEPEVSVIKMMSLSAVEAHRAT